MLPSPSRCHKYKDAWQSLLARASGYHTCLRIPGIHRDISLRILKISRAASVSSLQSVLEIAAACARHTLTNS